jgi:hypothetical protein
MVDREVAETERVTARPKKLKPLQKELVNNMVNKHAAQDLPDAYHAE